MESSSGEGCLALPPNCTPFILITSPSCFLLILDFSCFIKTMPDCYDQQLLLSTSVTVLIIFEHLLSAIYLMFYVCYSYSIVYIILTNLLNNPVRYVPFVIKGDNEGERSLIAFLGPQNM